MIRNIDWFHEVRVIDGGFGSECMRLSNLTIDGNTAWSSRLLKDDIETVIGIHKSFIKSGCDVICTNTYQASPDTLSAALSISRSNAIDIMESATTLVQRAIDTEQSEIYYSKKKLPILIAGSLGPYGACKADGSEYIGDYGKDVSVQELVKFHRERAEILMRSGVNLLAWETIPLSKEVSAICEVMRCLKAVGWISVNSSDGEYTVGGDPLETISSIVSNYDEVFGIGVNCVIPHHLIGKALSKLSSKIITENPEHKDNKILLFYANDGQLWVPDADQASCLERRSQYIRPDESGPDRWLSNIKPFIRTRTMQNQIIHSDYPLAQWVGGCCRIGPELISDLAKFMKPDEFRS